MGFRQAEIVLGEAKSALVRGRHKARTQGLPATGKLVAQLLREHLEFPLLKRRRAGERFSFEGVELPYAYHLYNQTWRNERCLEIAIAKWFLAGTEPGGVLEVGNVMSYYGFDGHRVVDKYERAPGVLNADVFDLDALPPFETVVSISTLEHVMFDEEEKDPRGSARALDAIRSVLSPGGRLLVTVPLGYNPGMDSDIRDGRFGFAEESFFQRVSAEGDWVPVAKDEALGCRYDAPFKAANAVLVGVDAPTRS